MESATASAIVVEENRDLIYKARMLYEKLNNKKEEIRKSYQENIIDTGISSEIEEKIDEEAKNTKKAIKIAGTVATVVLMFVPADGPFGEILTALATPAFCALVNIAADIKKKILITQKRNFEKYFMKADGSNQNISGYDLESGEYVEDFVALANNIDVVTKGA